MRSILKGEIVLKESNRCGIDSRRNLRIDFRYIRATGGRQFFHLLRQSKAMVPPTFELRLSHPLSHASVEIVGDFGNSIERIFLPSTCFTPRALLYFLHTSYIVFLLSKRSHRISSRRTIKDPLECVSHCYIHGRWMG